MTENVNIDGQLQEFEKAWQTAHIISAGFVTMPERHLNPLNMEKGNKGQLDQAINTMGQIGRAALVALKNRRQTISVTFDENRPDTIMVTVAPEPERKVIKSQLDKIIEALELARNADHNNGN